MFSPRKATFRGYDQYTPKMHLRNRIGSLLLVFFTALAGAGCSEVRGLVTVHTYLIPAKLKHEWITIEYENPRCPQLQDGVWGREFTIPESGYLCTSSSLYTGWHRTKYYAVDANGVQTAVGEDEIHREGMTGVVMSSLAPGAVPTCNVKHLATFFYGSQEKLTAENTPNKNEYFLQYHPECGENVLP